MTDLIFKSKIVLDILKSPPIKNSFGSVWLSGSFIMLHIFLYVYIVCLALYVWNSLMRGNFISSFAMWRTVTILRLRFLIQKLRPELNILSLVVTCLLIFCMHYIFMLALWSWKKIHTTSVEIDLGTVSYFSFFILLVFFYSSVFTLTSEIIH